MIFLSNYINGKQVPAISDKWQDVYNPATGEVYAQLPDSQAEDVEEAYKAAATAFPKWSETTVEYRSEMLEKIALAIEARHEELAQAESKDNGKPITLARKVDINRAAANFRFFSKAITQYSTEAHHTAGRKTMNYTIRKPLGVVGCISPWNLPLYLFSWKIAPALAAGNTVVAKPSEVTPYTASLLAEILDEVGLPAGVLNIVHGLGATTGQAIVAHPGITAISFTGGTKTGAHIAGVAAPMFKKLSLELGGKNPNIIFADCDFDKMLKTTLLSSFSNQGQICLCGSRIYVERSIYSEFKEAFVSATKKLRVGMPSEDDTQIGALVSEDHLNKVLGFVSKAEEEGGRILTGGNRITHGDFANGYFMEPTIIELESDDCTINQEEVFGPVVTLLAFDTEEEVLSYANATRYGLSATVWTENLSRAMRLTEDL
ncbi:MAG TPA: aldehyde dehydrogenase, partial [Flavobacteriaceae bacterium]|nr:aldehyde dehydrogenase [Flavobacteriaceae bacterium]